jgi:hypothetical protein
LACRYLENDQTYRQTADPQGRPAYYPTPPHAPEIDDRTLNPSTVWCMLSWLGAQGPALNLGRQLLQQQHPASASHRFDGAVARKKFRSPAREQGLRRARQVLHLIAEWAAVFPEKFFPRFATRAGFS